MLENVDNIKFIENSFEDIAEHANYIGYLGVHVKFNPEAPESVLSFISIFDSGILSRKYLINIPTELASQYNMDKGEIIHFENLPLGFLAELSKEESDIARRALSYF